MILATPGSHCAVFMDDDGRVTATKPVIAWDDDGHPLVTATQGLVRAERYPEFRRIGQPESPVVAAVPGGGWLIECTDADGGTWTDLILAWNIHADGTATPITTDRDGVTSDATSGLADYRIHHPDEVMRTKLPDIINGKPRLPLPDCPKCHGSAWIDPNPDDSTEAARRCDCHADPHAQATTTT